MVFDLCFGFLELVVVCVSAFNGPANGKNMEEPTSVPLFTRIDRNPSQITTWKQTAAVPDFI